METPEYPVEKTKRKAAAEGKDKNSRRLLYILIVVWLITVLALILVAWNAYFNAKKKTQSLAQQIEYACDYNRFGPKFSEKRKQILCGNAKRIIENDEPEALPGLPGLDGEDGLPGPPGPPGDDGQDGQDGRRGLAGLQGALGLPGEDGVNGSQGETGPVGAVGPPGPAGPAGPPGPAGPAGANGQNGSNATPFTFVFTIERGPLSSTYRCVIPEPNSSVTCEEQN